MKVCDYCGRESEDDALHCRECGTQSFVAPPKSVPEKPSEGPAPKPPRWEFGELTADEMKLDLVTLLTCRTVVEADMVVSRLAGVGIPAIIPDEFLMQAMSWNVNAFGYVRVQVSPHDYGRAKTFLLGIQEVAEANVAPTDPTAENKKLVQEFVEAVNGQDWNGFDELVAPGFVRHSSTFGQSQVRTRDQLREYLKAEFRTFPDAHESINFLVAEGDMVAVHSHCQATQQGPMGSFAASGKVLSAHFISIYRIAHGRILEAWVEWDSLNGLVQLGHLNPPAM
jgi:steroid delta-isomerase-like uncharacterized protein